MKNDAEILVAGKTAMDNINKQGKRLIDDWIQVGQALAMLSRQSMVQGKLNRKTLGNRIFQNFPSLDGQKYASTRSAAVWLSTQDEALLQELKKHGNLNHPVAIKKMVEERSKAAEAKANSTPGTAEESSTPEDGASEAQSPSAADGERPSDAASEGAPAALVPAYVQAVFRAMEADDFEEMAKELEWWDDEKKLRLLARAIQARLDAMTATPSGGGELPLAA